MILPINKKESMIVCNLLKSYQIKSLHLKDCYFLIILLQNTLYNKDFDLDFFCILYIETFEPLDSALNSNLIWAATVLQPVFLIDSLRILFGFLAALVTGIFYEPLLTALPSGP